jgi:DNA-binding NarL/FixJ family response regulator
VAIKLLLVDENVLVREGIKAALRSERGIRVVGESGAGDGELEETLKACPHVVLIDIAMSGRDGIDAIRLIGRRCPKAHILIYAADTNDELFRKAITAGAMGYVLKDISLANLVNAIRALHDGGIVLAPDLVTLEQGPESPVDPLAAERERYGLTSREFQVLVEVARGQSDKEVARKLYLSQSTVKSHLRAVFRKLRLRNRAQAAAFVVGHDWLGT